MACSVDRKWLIAGAVAAAALLAGCGGEAADRTTEQEAAESFEVPTERQLAGYLAESERVRFRASDSVVLDGRIFGDGPVAVVLSHMGDPSNDQAEWFPMARALARRGYTVLTYNTRGICPRARRGCSSGDYELSRNWMDIVGAYRFMRRRGAADVVLMGASVGSMGSLIAAGREEIDVSAVVAVSGVEYCCGYEMRRSTLRAVREPKLFVAAEGDSQAADGARQFFAWSEAPKQLRILPTHEHGSYLFAADPPAGDDARSAVFEFLERWAPAGSG